ncbi:MAG: ADP-ribosylation factor-like protein [Pseudomonadota bacterium]
MTQSALKIMFIGAMGVGKTSLVKRLVTGEFSSDYKSTLGVQLSQLTIGASNGPRDLVLWDTDGDTGEAILQSRYVIGTDATVIVCDVQRPKTLDTLLGLASAMEDALPGRPCLGVCNKVDLADMPKETATLLNYTCDITAATSALSGEGIEDAISRLVSLADERKADL